ncbi:uncharacterized protein LOC133182466 [Saccostrea echinata]|uniref:uncharacterized protein LOC133182466 n=1 Tax=Saccostrea echinata TaxID=191078 RepID=UPI002A812C7B|nr:uncharacterized protein LOC133182466 [Saccostrea echinata]
MANFSWSVNTTATTIANIRGVGSSTVSNVSTNSLLWITNERQYEINRPTFIIYIISTILGFIGNLLVIYVFGIRFKKSTANIFVTCLAVFDTIICFLLILETLDLRFPMYSGNYPALCKIVRFLEVFAKSCTTILLLCVALNRYYKVCKPLEHISIEKVKKILIASIVAAIFFSWPALLFHGSETMATLYPGITGKDCAADDNFKGSLYSVMYFILLFVITSCCIIALLALYSRVIGACLKRKFAVIGENQITGIWYSNTSYQFQRSSNKDLIRKIQKRIDNEQKQQSNSMVMGDKLGIENNSDIQKNDQRIKENKHQSRFVVLGEKYKSSSDSENSLTPDSLSKTELQNTPIPIKGILKNKSENKNELLNNSALAKLNGKYEVRDEPQLVNEKPKKSVSFKFSDAEITTHPKVTSSEPDDNSIKEPTRHLVLSTYEEELVDKVLRRTRNTKRIENEGKSSSTSNENVGSTTVMFCLVAVIYVVCYIPTLIVETINKIQPFNLNEMSTTNQKFLVMAYSASFMNLPFNPLIYSVFNKHFRGEIILMWKNKFK